MFGPPFPTKPAFLSALLALSSLTPLTAAPDDLDTVFTANAGAVYQPDDYGSVASIFVQPDGKVLVGSNEMATTLSGLEVPLLRFHPDGTVDHTFFADTDPNGDGLGIVFIGSGWPEVMALGTQTDGKIVAGGVMTGMNDGTNNVIGRSLIRLNADGTADPTFQNRGVSQWPTGNINYVEDLFIEPDDKIFITGGFGGVVSPAFATTTRYGIARLHADGSLDTTFHIDPVQFGVPAGASLVRGIFYQAVRDTAGRYYIAGELLWNGGSVNVLARLFPNGQRDTGFSPAGLPNARWNSVALAPDGRIYAIGQIDFQPSVMVALHPDGSFDPSFTLAPGLGSFASRPLQIDAAGRMLIQSPAGNNAWLKRLNGDGSVDATFDIATSWLNPPAAGVTPYLNTHSLSPGGKIYAGGGFDRVDGVGTVKIAAFEGDAPPAGFRFAFTSYGIAENGGTAYIAVTRQGPAATAGSVVYSTGGGTAIGTSDYTPVTGLLSWAAGETGTKYLAVPILDNAVADGDRHFLATLSSPAGGAILGSASAPVTIHDDEAAPVIVSHPLSLTVKQGFGATFSVAVSSPVPPAFQWFKDGVLMPGKTGPALVLTNVVGPGDEASYTVEVTAGGAPVLSNPATLTIIPPATLLDPAYHPAITESTAPVVFLPDGSLLAVNGNLTTGYTVQRFDPSGALAATWPLITTNATGGSLTLTPLPGGKFLASGSFTQINGVTRHRIARLNADGTLDTSFDTGLTNIGNFSGPVVTSSGAVYISYRPASGSAGLRRLLENGGIDPAFTSGLTDGTSGFLWSLAELADGSLLVGHTTGSTFGFTRGLAKLNPNGTPAAGFTDLSGLFPEPRHILPLPDGRFIVARNQILEIRLADGSVDPSFTLAGTLTGANINSIAIQRGRIVIAGPTTFNGQTIPGLARFSFTGQFDDNFPAGTGPTGGWANSFGAVGDDALVVRGTFTAWNGVSRSRIARLNLALDEAAFESLATRLSEDGGPLTVRVVRYGDSSSSASVRVVSAAGSASSPADFLAVDETITWAAGDASPKEIAVTPVDNAAMDGTRTFSLSLADGSGLFPVGSAMTLAIIDDESLPKITAQPQPVLAISGLPSALSVTVSSPTAASYQWFRDGVPIAGATAATYEIATASGVHEGVYTVRVTNAYESVLSQPARLTLVSPPAAITAGFTSTAGLFSGNILALAAAPDGGVYAGGAFTAVGGHSTRNRLAKVKADGSLDLDFTPPNISNNEVRGIAVQADGKVIVAGTFTTVDGVTRNRVIRLNTNGSLDEAFTTAIGAAANGTVNAVIVLADGSLLIGGGFTSWNGTNLGNVGLVKISAAGSYLGTANVTWPSSGGVQDILPLPDGRILISYDTTSNSQVKVRRLSAGLINDNSFVYPVSRTRVENIALAADGDYLFAGNGGLHKVSPDAATVTQWSAQQSYDVDVEWNGKVLRGGGSSLQRFLTGGDLDPSFVVTAQPNGFVSRFAPRADGRIWVAGGFASYNGVTLNRLMLINGDTIPIAITRQPAPLTIADPGEDVTLTVTAAGITAISYQWFKDGVPLDGKTSPALLLENLSISANGHYICVATNLQGSAESQAAEIIVRDAPEILSQPTDPLEIVEGLGFTLSVEAFGAPVLSYQWRRNGIALANGEGISGADTATLTVTNATTARSGLYTCRVANSIDSAVSLPVSVTVTENPAAMAEGFTPPQINGMVRAIHPLEGGRVLIGGDFSSVSDGTTTVTGSRLAVINPDGSVESVPGLSVDNVIYTLRDGGDGKILVAGNFGTINGHTRHRVARLNANLSLDEGFNPTGFTISSGTAYDIVREPSGTILVGGNGYVVRLASDGSPDPSFSATVNQPVNRVFPQAGGKAVILGAFTVPANYVARLNANGSHDNTITYARPTLDFGYHDGLDLGEGAFLASSEYFGYGVTTKYNADGTRDTTFLSQGNSSYIHALARDAEGRLLLGGNFTFIAGASRNRLVRLKADGTRDDHFIIGFGFDNRVEDILAAPDGSIWVGGNFTAYNGTGAQGLVRLKGQPAAGDPFADYLAAAGVPENLRGENDDADGDGIQNLIEYLYGTNPNSAASVKPVFASGSFLGGETLGGDAHPDKTYRAVVAEVPKDLRGLQVGLAVGTDFDFNDGAATEYAPRTDLGDTELRHYYLTPALQDSGRLFWRLEVGR